MGSKGPEGIHNLLEYEFVYVCCRVVHIFEYMRVCSFGKRYTLNGCIKYLCVYMDLYMEFGYKFDS